MALSSDRFRSLAQLPSWLDEHFEPIKVYGRGGDSPQVIYVRNDVDLGQARRALGELHPDADGRSTSAASCG